MTKLTKLVVALSLMFGGVVALAKPAAAAPAWSVVASPSPPAPATGTLLGTHCVTATSCFVVGRYVVGDTADRPLVGRFDGTTWSVDKAPVPPGDYEINTKLVDVDCTSSTNCFAVGGSDGSTAKMLVERWNGTSWSIVALPIPAGGSRTSLGGITCPTSTLCFAVGAYLAGSSGKTLIERWNGATWSAIPSPNGAAAGSSTALRTVACVNATSCLAIGSTSAGSGTTPFAARWNGTSWSSVAAPIQAGAAIVDLSGLACASTTACFAVGSTRTASTNDKPLIERWNGSTWAVAVTPNPTSFSNRLNAVSCPTSTSCFAVGEYGYQSDPDLKKTLIERWNGTGWSVVSSPNALDPNAPDFSSNRLIGISCATAANCVGVGESSSVVSEPDTLIERWNGTAWSIAAKGGSRSALQNVSCTSATNCFALGVFNDGSTTKTLMERWNGTRWTIVTTGNPGGLSEVSCVGTTTCFAVGRTDDAKTLVERWNGSSWSIVPSPNPAGAVGSELSHVSCASSTSCVAVGKSYDASARKMLTERWNGTSWSIVPISAPAGADSSVLDDVSCATATSCFAVGRYSVNVDIKPLIERWNGTSWAIVAGSNQASAVTSVSCASAASCFATASSLDGEKALIERWNGTSWAISPSPTAGGFFSELADVSCTAPTSCFAVGDVVTGAGIITLVEQWDGSSWSIVTSPNPPAAEHSWLDGVTCLSGSSCFAVGTFSTGISDWTLTERYA